LNQPSPHRSGAVSEIDLADLEHRIMGGDRDALSKLFEIYRPRLWRMVAFRMHPCLQGRIDADDVLQEAWLQVVNRMNYFYESESSSSFLWIRSIVAQAHVQLYRFHVETQKRASARELSIDVGGPPGSTSSCLVFHLSDSYKSPSSIASRAETMKQIDLVLQAMDEVDREILALRHFESLTNSEAAKILKLSEQAASIRYVRALGRLKRFLASLAPEPA
jgi:RNA polymerase sigma-70 factor, ECF subfamily